MTVALALAGTLAPAAAVHAQAPRPGGGAAPPAWSLAGFIGQLVQQLDEAGALDDAGAAGAAPAAVSRVSSSEEGSAGIAKPDSAGRPVRTASTCAWALHTRLEATYEPRGGKLAFVNATPEATLRCRGGAGLPVRQDAVLRHARDGATTRTLASERCASDNGCRSASVSGGYGCSGDRCAGTHRLTLEHTWTLPAPYTWFGAPSHCTVSDGGATLRCVTRGESVPIPASKANGATA